MDETSPQLKRLVKQLDLDRMDRDMFIGDPGKGQGRLFGGLVAAQSVVAAYKTVEEGAIHSLHAYFLRPGTHDVPIRYVIYRLRDGRTFTTRNVVAYQNGEAIFNVSCSFAKPEEGISNQAPMPDVPDPDGLPEWDFVRPDRRPDTEMFRRWRRERPVEIRACDMPDQMPQGGAPRRRVWMRLKGTLPEDPVIHAAVMAYSSDMGLLSTARQSHDMVQMMREMQASASLDHALWFHHPPRLDDWILYSSESPVAHAARALILGQMHRRDGTHIASVAQEGLIRLPRQSPPST